MRLLPHLPKGHFKIGEGRLSGWLCFLLNAMVLMSVFAFMFPAYLTIPELRETYNPDLFRAMMAGGLILASGFGAFAIYKQSERRFAWAGLAMGAIAMLLGGPGVAVGDLSSSPIYIGLDWFVIGLITTGGSFILLEKMSPLRREQPILREDWALDMKHFLFFHLLLGFFLLFGNTVVTELFSWAVLPEIGAFISSLPFLVQFGLILLTIDTLQYGAHRFYHETNFGWRIHSVHHSTEHMDWLASSRLNIIEPLITRTLGLIGLAVMGFDQGPINAYIIFVGFHATLIHANCSINFDWIDWLLVTPKYHHWHHAKTEEAVNKNYAVYLTFLDRIGGTRYCPKEWPEAYGVLDGEPPKTLMGQQLHPLLAK